MVAIGRCRRDAQPYVRQKPHNVAIASGIGQRRAMCHVTCNYRPRSVGWPVTVTHKPIQPAILIHLIYHGYNQVGRILIHKHTVERYRHPAAGHLHISPEHLTEQTRLQQRVLLRKTPPIHLGHIYRKVVDRDVRGASH